MPLLRLIIGWIEKGKHRFLELLKLQASPHYIASGFAMGVFIGIFPTFGLGAVAIMALATVWRFNIPAAFLGTLAGNPLLAPIWVTLSCLIGRIDPMEFHAPHETVRHVFGHFGQIGLRYLLGNLGVSLVFALAAYFATAHVVRRHQSKRK